MAAENRTGRMSFSSPDAAGSVECLNSDSQIKSPVLPTGASVHQSCTTSSPQTSILGATSVRILPTVHVARHPLTVCTPSSVSSAASFSSYTHRVRPLCPVTCNKQGTGSFVFSPVQQQQNIVTGTVPAVRQAVQPAAVLDLGNNGILNAVLGRLPNVGTMVVHNLDPGSLIHKNIVAMIDNTSAVTTATSVPIVNLQPVLSNQGAVAFHPSSDTSSQFTRHVSQHPLQPVIVSHMEPRVPQVAGSVTAKQHVAFSQSPISFANTSSQQRLSLNSPFVSHTVMVRSVASSGGQTQQLNFSVSRADGSQFPLIKSSEMIPRIKLPHAASSLPGAVVHYHTTRTVQTVQPSAVSRIQPDASFPIGAQLVATVPSRNAVIGSSIDTLVSSTLPPSESLTTLIPPLSVTIPFEIPQSCVIVKSAANYMATLSTQTPLVAGTSTTAVYQTGDHRPAAHVATSLIQMPTSTNVVCNSSNLSSSVFSTHQTFASYAPSSVLTVRHLSAPSVMLRQEQVGCSTKTKKDSVKRSPRQPRRRTTSAACSVSGHPTNVSQAAVLHPTYHSRTTSIPIVSPTKSVVSVMVDPLSYTAATCASTGPLLAGVKRKCSPGQKYTLFLENGCKYSSVYFDGEGFQAKKPAISSAQSGSCC